MVVRRVSYPEEIGINLSSLEFKKKELTFEKLMKVNWTEFEPVASFYASIAPMKISQRFGSAGLSEFSVYHA